MDGPPNATKNPTRIRVRFIVLGLATPPGLGFAWSKSHQGDGTVEPQGPMDGPPNATKNPTRIRVRFIVLGNVLLSQDPAVQVPSAQEGLTVVFGMGTRGSPPPSSPNSQGFCALKTGCEATRARTSITM